MKERPKGWRRFAACLALAFVLGLLCSAWAAWLQRAANQRALLAATQALAEKVAEQAVRQLGRASLGLRGARGYFMGAGLDNVGAEGFQLYMASRDLEQEFPGVLGFSLIRRVALNQEAAFVARQREQGLSGYSVKTLQKPATERRLVQLVEPLPTTGQRWAWMWPRSRCAWPPPTRR